MGLIETPFISSINVSSFRGMFAGGLRETQLTEIPVHGVTYLAMTKLLDFIYTSEIELDVDNVQEVLVAATLVQVGFSLSSPLFILFVCVTQLTKLCLFL